MGLLAGCACGISILLGIGILLSNQNVAGIFGASIFVVFLVFLIYSGNVSRKLSKRIKDPITFEVVNGFINGTGLSFLVLLALSLLRSL